jgi:hypothetical protein
LSTQPTQWDQTSSSPRGFLGGVVPFVQTRSTNGGISLRSKPPEREFRKLDLFFRFRFRFAFSSLLILIADKQYIDEKYSEN